MNNNLKVLKQLNTMVLLTIITQVIILIKSAIVASYFGISAEFDAYNLANRISTFIYSFIGAGVSTVIIPYLKEKVNNKGINIFISAIYTTGLLLLITLTIFREEIIVLAGGAHDYNFISLAGKLLVFTAITGFLNAIIQLVKGLLEFNDMFNIQKLIILFTNILGVIILLIGPNNIYFYSFLILFTAFLNVVFHVFFMRRTDFTFTLNYDIKDNTFKEMMTLFFPTMLSTGVYQISLLIDTLIAARLPIGSISILNYSNTIISMINLLFLGNITSFVYPKLVKKSNDKERQISLTGYILLVNVIMSLLIVLFFSGGREGIAILFERGEFSSQNTGIVFIVALILVLSLPTNAIRDLMYRYFYMNKDTFTPFTNSIIISVLNIVISLILSLYIGLYGVVLGTVLASYFSLYFISIRFKNKFKVFFNIRAFLRENIKIIIITALTLWCSYIFKNLWSIENAIISLLLYSTFSLVVYLILLKVFKSKVFKIKL